MLVTPRRKKEGTKHDLGIFGAGRPPEGGQKARWKARLTDGATWRDFTYFLLLLPLGIAEFVLLVTSWSVALGLLTLPIYFRHLPGGPYYFPGWDIHWFVVDSTLD